MLRFTTGHTDVDRTLTGLIDLFEGAFPNRIRGYYLEGSYADSTALATSDIDLIILFRESFVDDAEREQAERMAERYDVASPFELDVSFLDDSQIARGAPPALKRSVALFGESLPDTLPMVSVAEWGRERMHIAYWLMTKVFDRPDVVTLPREYPLPQAEFYGYTERTIRLPDGTEAPSTRDLIRVMGWAGTALVARIGNQIVTRKKDSHILYRQHVGDEWASFFESIYHQCREKWRYLIPEDPGDRERLRIICQRALKFENHFLKLYKAFFLSELRTADDSAKAHALWVQAKIPFIDPEIFATVKALSGTDDKIGQQAAQVMTIYDTRGK